MAFFDELSDVESANIKQFSESDARCILADTHNEILRRIYANLQSYYFDPVVNLEDVPEAVLTNFGLAATGFLGVQNFENLADGLEDREIDNIVNGTFNIKQLSPKEVAKLTEGLTIVPKKGKNNTVKYPLHRIQDGSYSIVSRYGKNTLVLKTTPVKYYTNNPNRRLTSKDVFHMIRNLAAHSVPYKCGTGVIFFTDDGYIEVSRMWFRGYSELFANQKSVFDIDKARTILKPLLKSQCNNLETFADINKALSLIKGCFDKNILANFFRVNNFVKFRIQYHDGFFEIDPEDRLEVLLQIIDKNPNYLLQASETISPRIIYNLQQLTSLELFARSSTATLSSDHELNSIGSELMERQENIQSRFEFLKNSKTANRTLVKLLERDFEQLMADMGSFASRYETSTKLESSNMDLYDLQDSLYLPTEVAVNTVALMAYNSLVTSGFCEDVFSGTRSTGGSFNLNDSQKRFFDSINLDEIDYYYYGKPLTKPYSAEDKCFIISAIRNSICHALVSYRYPPLSQDATASFKNTEMTFYLDREDVKVVASVDAFYRMFAGGEFTKKRHSSIITGPTIPMRTQTPEVLYEVSKFEKAAKKKSNDDGSDD